MKYHLYALWRYLVSCWYFKILGRKRDRDKDHDCKYFEESNVNISKFQNKDGFDEEKYLDALRNAGKPANRQECYGDGHYKCYECMKLDYINSDLIKNIK